MEHEAPKTAPKSLPCRHYPAMTPLERLAVLRQIRGMWKGHKPDPIETFVNMRKEGERELPPLHP